MAATNANSAEMITQLESARKLALNDPQVYSQVVPGILPLIGPQAALDIRRWGADFLAECFATPSFPNEQKEQLVADVLPTLHGFLENASEDPSVLRSVVQTAASLYPLVFKRMYVIHSVVFAVCLPRTESYAVPNLTRCLLQSLTSRPVASMADHDCYQDWHPTTNGLGAYCG